MTPAAVLPSLPWRGRGNRARHRGRLSSSSAIVVATQEASAVRQLGARSVGERHPAGQVGLSLLAPAPADDRR
jgi:hypothetical protein